MSAQIVPITEAQIEAELDKRGLEEEAVREALIANGFDPDNLENLSPSEIADLERIINELERGNTTESENESEEKINSGGGIKEINQVDVPQDTLIEMVEEEFEEEIEDLPPAQIYGQEIFRNKTIRVYRQSEEVKAPEYYVLGPGDEIGISIWGKSQIDKEYTISKDGYIRILDGNSLRVNLKGLSFSQAREKLRKVFTKYYSFNQGEFEITLNYSRTIQVSVYGDVLNPGSISIPATNTAFSALVAVNGPTDIGSVRNIELVKANGTRSKIDIYEYMSDPSVAENYYLEDNDIIIVPVAQKVISIKGAVNKSFKFELLENENLLDLIKFAGGLKDNAYTEKIQIKRYDGSNQKLIDVFYDELVRKNKDFKLVNGDEIMVDEISRAIENYVNISGEVIKSGDFERTKGMRLLDLINLAGLTKESKTDKAYLQRTNADQTTSFMSVNIDKIIDGSGSAFNITLQDFDKLIIWPQSRFTDQMTIEVNGAVRVPSIYDFDIDQNVKVSDLITLAGGLRRDASSKAIIQRVDPLRQKETIYIRVDLNAIAANENSSDNVVLSGYDKLIVYSENAFIEEANVEVLGAVNQPGQFLYGKNMELKDAILLAGGFRKGAARNKVELSRIVIKDNDPTKTIIANLELDNDYNILESDNQNFSLEPFDAILVRYIPDFEMQKYVVLTGEVKYPGPYPIISKNEKISSIIERAGGLTDEAYAEGATLYRAMDEVGNVVIKLGEIIKNDKSRFNFNVRGADELTIPKRKDFVTITGATRVSEVLRDEAIGSGNTINVPFHKGKSAMFYINEYAGGLAKDAKRSLIFVEHPNGQLKRTSRFLFWSKSPEVLHGSVIKVGREPVELDDSGEEKEPVDWNKVLNDSVAQAMSVLTLLVLIKQSN